MLWEKGLRCAKIPLLFLLNFHLSLLISLPILLTFCDVKGLKKMQRNLMR